jgi:hypothetical protein
LLSRSLVTVEPYHAGDVYVDVRIVASASRR